MTPYSTATQILVDAITAYKAAHNIPFWEDTLIRIAEPHDEEWAAWQEDGSLMTGDPQHSEIALNYEGFGAYYGCVEAAVADLAHYFG